MKVIFTTTTKSKLATLPITNGQIIALSDAVGYYYDMAGIRYPASSTQVLDSLPATGIVDMLYIVNNAVYTWDGIEFVKLISSIEIDDSTASTVSTYSSSKIEDLVSTSLADVIDDTTASTSTAYSSQKTKELIEAVIDDSSASTATAYSSQKTDEQIAAIIDDSTSSTATAYSGAKVDTLIQGVTSFEVEIVQALPTEDIDTHTIYFLEKSTPGQQNYYEEYMYIENTWELIGTTEVTISIATTATAGIVKPDGTTISVAADGTITAIGGGSSGHTIMDDAGSTLSAEDNLQFKGAYVEDDSANDKTIVNVVRDMNYADVASLTAVQKKGIIITEKDRLPSGTVINATNTGYSNTVSGLTATDVQAAIDEVAETADVVTAKLTNALIYKGTYTISAEIENSDTYNTVMNKLFAALTTYLATKSATYRWSTAYASVASYRFLPTTPIIRSATDTFTAVSGASIQISSDTYAQIAYGQLSTSNSQCRVLEYDNGTLAIINKSSTTFTSSVASITINEFELN